MPSPPLRCVSPLGHYWASSEANERGVSRIWCTRCHYTEYVDAEGRLYSKEGIVCAQS
jgi:hypothetical protein